MLHSIHPLSLLYIGRTTSPEVEIQSAKVHLSEVFAIVHVGKVVNIGGPAEAIGDTFLVEVQGRK